MGVDGCWCAPWSSKPVMGVRSLLGGFDSHIFPPDKKPCNHCDCGAFVFIYEKRAALLAQPFLVLVTGIEPVRVLPHGILSPGRLPVPPHQHAGFSVYHEGGHGVNSPLKSLRWISAGA